MNFIAVVTIGCYIVECDSIVISGMDRQSNNYITSIKQERERGGCVTSLCVVVHILNMCIVQSTNEFLSQRYKVS